MLGHSGGRGYSVRAACYANVVLRWQGGRTPLHMAALHGHFEAAQLLLYMGADVAATDQVRRMLLLLHARRAHALLQSVQ